MQQLAQRNSGVGTPVATHVEVPRLPRLLAARHLEAGGRVQSIGVGETESGEAGAAAQVEAATIVATEGVVAPNAMTSDRGAIERGTAIGAPGGEEAAVVRTAVAIASRTAGGDKSLSAAAGLQRHRPHRQHRHLLSLRMRSCQARRGSKKALAMGEQLLLPLGLRHQPLQR